MPPKKKAPKKKKMSKHTTVINGVSTAEMSKEELVQFVNLLREELDKERQERNITSLEKDKIITFWELTKKQLEDARALLSKKERELEDADERHQLEMKVYRQKLKHLLFEENSRESEARKEALQDLANAKDDARFEIRSIRGENYILKAKLRQQQLKAEETVKMLKRDHELELSHIRQDFVRQAEEIESRAAKQMAMLREQIDTQRRVEVHMTEEHKNKHIQQLEANHERAFATMKAYYNDVTLGNISVIKTLRENIDDLRSQLGRVQHLYDAAQKELGSKTGNMNQLEKDITHLRYVSKQFENEKAAHALTKSNKKKVEALLEKAEMNLEIMTERYNGLEKVRNDMVAKFENLLMDVQQRTGLRALLVEKKLQKLTESLEAREAQIMQLIVALESDPKAVEKARQHLENLLKNKNQAIEELQYEVMRMGKAYNELWSACQRKLLDEMNSPHNLGISPVQVNVNLTSPFNPATAIGRKIVEGTTTGDHPTQGIEKPKNDPQLGRGPTGLASVAPF